MPNLKNVGSGNSNIRDGNYTSANIIGKLAPGHSLTLLGNAEYNSGYNWYIVDYNGQQAYIADAGGLQIQHIENVDIKSRLHWNHFGMHPVEYRWHSDMRFTIASKMANNPYFFDNFARVGFDFFFCYGPYEEGHVYTPYPYAISFHGMTNGFYWNARDFGQGGYVERYFDFRAECENRWGNIIYDHSGAPLKTPSGAARLPGVPENVNMTYGHLYTALKMGVCVYIRAWARTHSTGTTGGPAGYIYSGFWDGVNNVPGSSHTFDNGLGISHPRCVVVQDSIGARSENICKAKLRVHGKARVWNGVNCYVSGTRTVGDSVYKVAIMAAVQDEIQGLSGNTPNANAGFDTPRGAKQIFRQDIQCTDEARDTEFSFNPVELFGDSKRGKRIALRVWYKYPDLYDNWNTYGPDYEAYRENMKIDGHIPFPSTAVNRRPDMWYETSCELRKDNSAIGTDLLARGGDPEGDEYATWANMTFDTGGHPVWAPWVEIRHKQNANHSNLNIDFYQFATQIIQKSNGSLALSNIMNKPLCTELFAFDGFSGSGVWQNCPVVNKWQSHSPRFDMRPRNVSVSSDKDAGDRFTFTLNYEYPISGCRHMLIICPEGDDGLAHGIPLERYILGTSWRDWGFNLTDWSPNKSVTVNLPDYYGDEHRGKMFQLLHGVISPWGWETTNGWNVAGIKKVRFNEYPVCKTAGVKVNNGKTTSGIINAGTFVQTGRDNTIYNMTENVEAGRCYVISGYMECTATADGRKTASLGISFIASNGNRDWVTNLTVETGTILNNKTYFSGTFRVPGNCRGDGFYCWSQIDIPAGTPGYSVTFSDVKYKIMPQGAAKPDDCFITGDIIDISTVVTDRDGIKNHILGFIFESGGRRYNKSITVTTDKVTNLKTGIDVKSLLTEVGLDYKAYVGYLYHLRTSGTDKLGLGRDPFSNGANDTNYELRFDYKPTMTMTSSKAVGTYTRIIINPANYTAARKTELQIKRAEDSSWKTLYASSSNETREIAYDVDPTLCGYSDSDRGKVFNIRARLISNTGMFESDWTTVNFTWGAPPNITITSIDADYSIKDGVTRRGRFGTIATFNYRVVSSGPATIEIQTTINGVTKTVLTKNVNSGTTTHSDRIDLKNSFSNVFCDYDATFAIKGRAYGLVSVATSTNDYGASGKMVFLEPFHKGTVVPDVLSAKSIKTNGKVHGVGFVLNSTSPNSPYAKTRGVNMNIFRIFRGVAGNEENTKVAIYDAQFNGNAVQALSNAKDLLAEKCSMTKGVEYKFKIVIEVYYFQSSTTPSYTTEGDWSTDLFRYTPDPTPAILVAPINAGLSNTAIPCRRPPFIFTVPNQTEEGNKVIDVVEVKWNGVWINSSSSPARFDNVTQSNAGRTIKFYPPNDSTNNNVNHGAKLAVRSGITHVWTITEVSLIMVDPQEIRKGVGTLIEIYSEPRELINRLRRAYNLSNYNFPSLTARDTPITRDNLINCLATAQNEVATKVNSYAGTKQIPTISYENLEYITSSQTDEVYTKLATFGTI